MNSYEAFTLVYHQLKRHITGDDFATRIVMAPSSFSGKGVHMQVAILKTYKQQTPNMGAKPSRMLRVRLAVKGSAESPRGLEMALSLIDQLDDYLDDRSIRLERNDDDGTPIPNTRIVQTVSPEDSFLDAVDSTSVQDVEDVRTLVITIPNEG
jgi:hypothetical protein